MSDTFKFNVGQTVGFVNSIQLDEGGRAFFDKLGVVEGRHNNPIVGSGNYYNVRRTIYAHEIATYVDYLTLMREDRLLHLDDISKYDKGPKRIRLKVGDTFYVKYFSSDWDERGIIHIDQGNRYIVYRCLYTPTRSIHVLTDKEIEKFNDYFLDKEKTRRMTSEHLFY